MQIQYEKALLLKRIRLEQALSGPVSRSTPRKNIGRSSEVHVVSLKNFVLTVCDHQGSRLC